MTSYKTADTTVVLLAAGRGRRMQTLTETTPKPLLKVGQHTLIEHHLLRLQSLGFKHVVVNLAYLGEQIREQLGNGRQYQLKIDYSDESASGALETAGGLKQALPLIKSDPFLVVNADIWTDFSFESLLAPLSNLGRLVLVDNPNHNPEGDFAYNRGYLSDATSNKLTFSGIALYRKSIFQGLKAGKCALGPVLRGLIANGDLEAVKHLGIWTDVGTPERLTELNQQLSTV